MSIESVGADSVEQAARRQGLFREVNEHIAELSGRAPAIGFSLLICECSDTQCAEALEVTPAEYEAVRAWGTRFFVVPGHQLEEIERVVEGSGRFLVVEKLGAAAAVVAADTPGQAA